MTGGKKGKHYTQGNAVTVKFQLGGLSVSESILTEVLSQLRA